MRYDHFSMLPERAFQPRGPYGMTLEGGGGGIIGAIGDVFESAVDVVKDVVSFIDDKVIQPIVKDPISAIATTVGAVVGGPVGAGVANTVAGLVQGESPEEAIKGGVVSGLTVGAGQALLGGQGVYGGDVDVQPGGFYGESAAPISEAIPVSTNPVRFPGVEVQPTYTPSPGSFQEALPGLGVSTQASTAPFTALPGTFQAATAATDGLLSKIASPSLSLTDALRGARLVSGLLTPQQQQQMEQQQIGNLPQGLVDYSQLLGLLSQRARGTGLLGTQFQPQPLNLTSLLG